MVSEDGEHFGRKRELMRNSDYPQDLTCHVRDPKVWKEKRHVLHGAGEPERRKMKEKC